MRKKKCPAYKMQVIDVRNASYRIYIYAYKKIFDLRNANQRLKTACIDQKVQVIDVRNASYHIYMHIKNLWP